MISVVRGTSLGVELVKVLFFGVVGEEGREGNVVERHLRVFHHFQHLVCLGGVAHTQVGGDERITRELAVIGLGGVELEVLPH